MEDLDDLDGDAEAEVDQDLEGEEDDNEEDDDQEDLQGSAPGMLSRTQSNSQQRLTKTDTQDRSQSSLENAAGSSNGVKGAGPTSHPNPQVLFTSPSPTKTNGDTNLCNGLSASHTTGSTKCKCL